MGFHVHQALLRWFPIKIHGPHGHLGFSKLFACCALLRAQKRVKTRGQDAHDAFLNMSVPVLKWLEDLDDGHGRLAGKTHVCAKQLKLVVGQCAEVRRVCVDGRWAMDARSEMTHMAPYGLEIWTPLTGQARRFVAHGPEQPKTCGQPTWRTRVLIGPRGSVQAHEAPEIRNSGWLLLWIPEITQDMNGKSRCYLLGVHVHSHCGILFPLQGGSFLRTMPSIHSGPSLNQCQLGTCPGQTSDACSPARRWRKGFMADPGHPNGLSASRIFLSASLRVRAFLQLLLLLLPFLLLQFRCSSCCCCCCCCCCCSCCC